MWPVARRSFTMTSPHLASAPSPLHIIRSHTSAISSLFISGDNERIYSGDISGLAVITSTRSFRPLASWKAHTDGLLGLEEWGKQVITHGRDNKLHVWKLSSQNLPTLGGSALAPGTLIPELSYSLDVNALNFCRFSLLRLDVQQPPPPPPPQASADTRALVAVPNLVESSLADIWAIPSMERMHAAVGKGSSDTATMFGSDGRGTKNSSGIIMSMHLLNPSGGATRMADRALSLITSYENGSVKLWRYRNVEKERSIEGLGWECLWSFKLHVESVMATAVSLDRSIALSVSADHLVGRYDLKADLISNLETIGTVFRMKHPGNGAVAFHDDGRVCAIGGWDGRVRLYSTKTFKALGTLVYHKDALQALSFAHARPVAARHHHQHYPEDSAGGGGECGARVADISTDTNASRSDDGEDGEDNVVVDDDDDCGDADEGSDEDDEMSGEEKARRSRWLVSGGKDGRVVVWALMDFTARGDNDGRREH
ncbi:WD40-repeat-containing domain protein [Russula decolorans]